VPAARARAAGRRARKGKKAGNSSSEATGEAVPSATAEAEGAGEPEGGGNEADADANDLDSMEVEAPGADSETEFEAGGGLSDEASDSPGALNALGLVATGGRAPDQREEQPSQNKAKASDRLVPRARGEEATAAAWGDAHVPSPPKKMQKGVAVFGQTTVPRETVGPSPYKTPGKERRAPRLLTYREEEDEQDTTLMLSPSAKEHSD
jgi:hypothetical protein